MAQVFKGRHEALDRDVAVKILSAHLAEDEDFLARFHREAQAVAALRHPHIVQVSVHPNFGYRETSEVSKHNSHSKVNLVIEHFDQQNCPPKTSEV